MADTDSNNNIFIKQPHEIEKMRAAGRVAADTLEMVSEYVRAGVTTGELNSICHRYILDQNCIPAPLDYHGFPKSICTSLNHQVCHGIPGKRRLKAGDILNIDVTVIKDGYHGDTSRMFFINKPSIQARRLVEQTYVAMRLGIALVKPGICLGDIGHAIQTFAEKNYYTVVREYCGHGIGKSFHEEPQVLHYGKPGTGVELKPGMVFTIEPMINAGERHVRVLPDEWTVVTRDHSLSAQWEHTIAVTQNGHDILTLRADEKPTWKAGDTIAL